MPYRTMFETLSISRGLAIGMETTMPLPIAYSEISQYARDMGLATNATEIEECVRLVRAQDTEYLNHAAEMRKKHSRKTTGFPQSHGG